MENTRLERFVKVLGDEVPLRARASLVAETAEEASVAVELLSDFVHAHISRPPSQDPQDRVAAHWASTLTCSLSLTAAIAAAGGLLGGA